MVPDNIKAEAVNGGDLGIMDQRQLLKQMGISRIIIHSGGKSLGNPLPHLGRRRIGKGNHKEPVDIHRMLPVAYHLYDPFHQYRRFSAACRRRDQKRTAPVLDGGALGRRPFRRAHIFPSPCALHASARVSNTSFGACTLVSPRPSSCRQTGR